MSKKKKPAGNTPQAASKTSKVIVWIVLAIVLLVVALVLINSYTGSSSDEAKGISYENQPVFGDENAPVKIVEFGDYKCIHCQDFHDRNFPVIDQELIQTGKASFYFMNMPIINQQSNEAAHFAESVYQVLGDDVFWDFHDALYEEDLNTAFSEELFMDKLRNIVSTEEAEEVLHVYQEDGTEDAVKSDKETAADLEVKGTPTIFVNGKLFEGEDMNDLIEMVNKETQGAN